MNILNLKEKRDFDIELKNLIAGKCYGKQKIVCLGNKK